MSQSSWAKWELPSVVDPVGRRCFVIRVPDERFHIAAFRGALLALGSAYKWADDASHTAKDVAQVWRTVIDNMEDCVDINIRLKPTDFCVLQLTTDGGLTWSDVADLSACAHAAAVDEIGQAIDRGDLSGGGQQPGQGSGNPGECYDYDITINGNDRWLAPVSIQDGDIVTVTVKNGAWWHGDVTHLNWNCPDGTYFGLGSCFGTGYTDAADPLPAELKMRLIGNIPGAAVPYFDMYNTARTIAAGVVPSDFYLQANDDNLADNQGSVTLHVQICKAGWHHHFDFSTGANGWTINTGSVVAGGIAGAFVDAFSQNQVDIQRTIAATTIIRMRAVYDMASQSGVNGSTRWACAPGGIYGAPQSAVGTGLVIDELETRAAVTIIDFAANSGTSAGPTLLKEFDIWGLGADPF